MPSVSLFGIIGNFISMHILHHREVKLKKDYVDVLCMLATFDNLLLISTFLLFSLPTLSENYTTNVRAISLFLTYYKYLQVYSAIYWPWGQSNFGLIFLLPICNNIFLFWPCPIIWFGVSTTELSDVTSISLKYSRVRNLRDGKIFIISKVFYLPTFVSFPWYPKCNQTISVYLLLLFVGSFL